MTPNQRADPEHTALTDPLARTEVIARLRRAGCVFAEQEARLLCSAATTADELAAMVWRRAAGTPLEVVVGWAEFNGSRIGLDPGVFVPRRRTELLVRAAVTLSSPGSVVVDLCCGSAAVGAGIHAERSDIELYAADIDSAAVCCARRNLSGRGTVYQGDLYAALPASLRARVRILTVNAPYVPSAAVELMPAEAREHEARIALDGGPDGLDVQRRVISAATDWLVPTGYLLIETSQRQRPHTVRLCRSVGLSVWSVRSAERDATVVIGQRSAH